MTENDRTDRRKPIDPDQTTRDPAVQQVIDKFLSGRPAGRDVLDPPKGNS